MFQSPVWESPASGPKDRTGGPARPSCQQLVCACGILLLTCPREASAPVSHKVGQTRSLDLKNSVFKTQSDSTGGVLVA